MQSQGCLEQKVRRWLVSLGMLALATLAGLAHAQSAEPDLAAMALKWARSNVAATLPDSAKGLRMDVSVGALDSRLRLAPCGNIEPYLPIGSRLWGHGRVGLRCVDGVSKWNVSVPVTVKAYGNAWVVRGWLLPEAW